MAGGEYPDGSASKAVWRYDPTLDVWQEVESMQTPRSELGKNTEKQFETCRRHLIIHIIFEMIRIDTWDQKRVCFAILGLALLDGYVYAVGGWEGTSRLDSVERYNPESNTWHSIPNLRMAVTSPAVVTHEGNPFV